MKARLKLFAGMTILTGAICLFATGSHAIPIISTAHLTGPGENPANASPGIW
jgi:hypothetical protein